MASRRVSRFDHGPLLLLGWCVAVAAACGLAWALLVGALVVPGVGGL